MTLTKKIAGLAGLVGCALGLVIVAQPARAASVPCSTAKLIVPWGAGGDTDIVFRLLVNSINANGAKPKLQVVNIGGQGGNKGAKEVMAAKPDGCTLLAIHESIITTHLAGRIDFTWDAFVPVARVTYTPSVFGANAKAPFDDIPSMVAYAKKNPEGIKVAVTTGSTSQFVYLIAEDEAGIKFKYVPYEGTRERMTAILAHNVDLGEVNILAAKKYIKEGSMKAVGIATEKRDPIMPDLKTVKEQGLNVVYGLNRGVVLPKGAKPDVVALYEGMFQKALDDPKVKKAFDEKGTWTVYQNHEDYAKFLAKSFKDHEKVAIKIGMYKKK